MNASRARRHPWWTVLTLLVVLALVAGVARWATKGEDEAPRTATGPEGSAFYEPSAEVVADGEHGSVIWSRRVVTGPTIGGTTHLVLYRSTSAKGETVPVSGVVTVPEGTPPKGGWPIVSWGHGTTGMADDCAPSRSAVDEQTGVYTALMDEVTAGLVEDGHAVVRTDYEGLGTPGPHPYLMGQSAGAAMTDIVLAARELDRGLSRRWLAMGHSQGAQAALFTSRFTDAYTPGLDLVGIVALAPPSQLGFVVEMLGTPGDRPSGEEAAELDRTTGGSVFLGPLIVAAARIAGVPEDEVVSARGRTLLPHLQRRCIAELSRQDSLGGLAPRDFIATDADLSRIRGVVGTNDAAELNPQVPLMLVQGEEDTTVPKMLTDRLDEQLGDRGADVEYVTLPGADHLSMLKESRPRVRAWVADAFAG